jgi:hypothetical protein
MIFRLMISGAIKPRSRKIYVSVKNVEDLDFLRQNLCVIVLTKNIRKTASKLSEIFRDEAKGTALRKGEQTTRSGTLYITPSARSGNRYTVARLDEEER